MAKRSITVDDLFNLKLIFDPQISPDGKTIAFVLTTPDLNGDKYHSHIWLAPSDGSAPARQFTFGDGKDRAPRWSPDGKTIAFVSDRDKDRGDQLYLISITGGEARRLTDDAKKPGAAIWSPDGKQIAFVAKVIARAVEQANGAREKSDVKAYTRLNYKADGNGFWDYGWQHIFTISPDGGNAQQLTRGNYNHVEPTWSPDSRAIVFVANRSARADLTRITDLWSVPARGGALKRLTRRKGPTRAPAFSPDGKSLAFVGHNNEFANVTEAGIYILPARGGDAIKITRAFDRTYDSAIASDLRVGAHTANAPHWSRDGNTLYFLATDGGASNIYSAPARGGAIKPITRGAHQIFAYSFARAANRFAFAITDALNPNDLFASDARGNLTQLTRVNADALRDIQLVAPERFVAPRENGWSVEGWVMKPIGWKPGRKYPAILEIHGGPHGAYGNTFFHEFQLMCAHGFAVVFTNPRGSAGYGQEFAKCIGGDWGGGDYRDLIAALDYARAQFKWIDAQRLGVAGGSYGGYMTSWIVTHTNQFRAALSERALNNWHSFHGTSDIGNYFASEWYIGGEPWDKPADYFAHSPIAHVAHCKTPTLIIHSEKDFRCPIEQGEQFYIALKKLGVPTQFVRFPDESHDLNRNGKPKHRKERLERIAAWFQKYLK
jgi:dipeptidyl aminopeptidase/acylaminoacyl peptidase